MREPQHICRAVERLARRGDETWQALRDAARRSGLVNAIDETSLRRLAHARWLGGVLQISEGGLIKNPIGRFP